MREHSTSVLKGAVCPILDVSFEAAVANTRLSDSAKRKADYSVTSYDSTLVWDSIIALAGARYDPISLGRKMANGPLVPIFLACTCAPNLRVGLQRVARYKALFGPVLMVLSATKTGLRVELRPEEEGIDLSATLLVPMSVFIVEKARNHTARQIDPVKVTLPPNAFDQSAIEAYFGCPAEIADFASLEFTEKDISTRFLSQNDTLWREIERELEHKLQEHNSARPFHAEVEATIRSQLYSGSTHAEAVCDALRISRSTLQRRLREEGHNFQDILERVRFELAVRYLTKSDFNISEIARMVGFMDPKSFFRAFRQRFGQTPEEFRANKSAG